MSVMVDVSPLLSAATLLRREGAATPQIVRRRGRRGASQSIAGPIGTIPVGLIVLWLW